MRLDELTTLMMSRRTVGLSLRLQPPRALHGSTLNKLIRRWFYIDVQTFLASDERSVTRHRFGQERTRLDWLSADFPCSFFLQLGVLGWRETHTHTHTQTLDGRGKQPLVWLANRFAFLSLSLHSELACSLLFRPRSSTRNAITLIAGTRTTPARCVRGGRYRPPRITSLSNGREHANTREIGNSLLLSLSLSLSLSFSVSRRHYEISRGKPETSLPWYPPAAWRRPCGSSVILTYGISRYFRACTG